MTAHPSDADLVEWLGDGRPSKVARHLDDCGVCLDRLDRLTDLDVGTRSGLVTATAPPPDLEHRTAGAVRGRLALQEAASMVFELFTLPWRTFEVLAGPDGPGGRVTPSGPHDDDDADDDGERRDG